MKEFFQHVKSIMMRELASYFNSPIAYVFMIIFLVLTGFCTFSISRFYEIGQADLRPFFMWHPWLYLILIPAVAMRSWAEERRSKTIELLFTLSVTPLQAILGKFFAAWFFLFLTLVLTFPVVLSACYLGTPDLGVILCGYLGSLLMAGAYLSIGQLTSALTRNQVISFILAVLIGFFMILSGYSPITDMLSQWAPVWLVDLVAGFSFMFHFESIGRGIIDLRDISYFVSVTGFMLFVTNIILNNKAKY